MRKDSNMNTKPVNKRKSASESKHHVEPKFRKKDNVESLTKTALLKKYSELEDKFMKVVSDNEELKQINKSLSDNITTLEKETTPLKLNQFQ